MRGLELTEKRKGSYGVQQPSPAIEMTTVPEVSNEE